MINNTSSGKWDRLNAKNLDSQFKNEIMTGLNCSLFESEAILNTVHQVYGDYFKYSDSLQPGKTNFVVISIENSPARKLTDAIKKTVTLTLDDGKNDLTVREKGGVIAMRRHRLQRICNEAFIQGGLLTVEDIANRIFCCGERTLVRDIKYFKDKGIMLPLRSTIKDMGRTLSHRKLIVEKWLNGYEYSEIIRTTNHSIDAINNYISKFKQVVALSLEKYDTNTIAFLTKISGPLVKTYVQMWQELYALPHRKSEIESLVLKKNKTYKKT
ncbi:MAG: DUF1670 domain-containing protein [Bacteroidales bacterium]|nr:DUF1670 domain-containing protein [Bacteroidales bacterium]